MRYLTSQVFLPAGLLLVPLLTVGSGRPDGSGKPAQDCEAALWQHVYKPARLQVLVRCKVVTGIIEEMSAQPDGDEHMLLRLDPGQEALVNRRNAKRKRGDLVIEVVCANRTKQRAPKQACQGYANGVELPQVGKHVRVTGSYVLDTSNGWTEIHPASRIEAIR